MAHVDRVVYLTEKQFEQLVMDGKLTVNGEEKAYSDNALYIVPNAQYPVGVIYLSVNETSPAQLFGGTWERIKDRFLLSAGDSYTAGSTGGSAEVTLTEGQMPRHSHAVNLYSSTWQTGGNYIAGLASVNDVNSPFPTGTTQKGNNEPHNNMPPYLTVYMWQRIS